MTKTNMIKNITFSEAQNLESLVNYEEGRVVSRTLSQNNALGITLFAFDEGEGISAHSASGDAMVFILDGEALIDINGKKITAKKGDVVIMPADVPHTLDAVKQFKMLLTVVKKSVEIGI